jgi:hypothetical protein
VLFLIDAALLYTTAKHESDYAKWGIEINVNFRAGESASAILDAQTQSGGVCSRRSGDVARLLESNTRC